MSNGRPVTELVQEARQIIAEYEEPGDLNGAIARTVDKFVPVDSGTMLVVDPCHLSADLLERLTTPNRHGVTLAVVVSNRADGQYWVEELGEGEFSVYRG